MDCQSQTLVALQDDRYCRDWRRQFHSDQQVMYLPSFSTLSRDTSRALDIIGIWSLFQTNNRRKFIYSRKRLRDLIWSIFDGNVWLTYNKWQSIIIFKCNIFGAGCIRKTNISRRSYFCTLLRKTLKLKIYIYKRKFNIILMSIV